MQIVADHLLASCRVKNGRTLGEVHMLKITQIVAKDVLIFLDQQRLAATPSNYALAYALVTDSDSALKHAADQIIYGGVRMSQEEADELFLRFVGGVGVGGAVQTDKSQDIARHHAIRLGEITRSAASATGDFNRELSAGYVRLENGETVDFAPIVADMIQRSERAENDLEAAALEVAALREELDVARHDATKDALTGLNNRRAIDMTIERLSDQDEGYLLAICDIDKFKSVNDRYGHAVGDRVLKTVAASLTESCAPHTVGRWGGEEFLIILPGLSMEQGVALLDKARRDLGQRAFKLRETDEPMGAITFSGGVAMVKKGECDTAMALNCADAALYRAKKQGRNLILAGNSC
ncbi:MAG: GGDEF domain-containing protein [Sphingobium sp.]